MKTKADKIEERIRRLEYKVQYKNTDRNLVFKCLASNFYNKVSIQLIGNKHKYRIDEFKMNRRSFKENESKIEKVIRDFLELLSHSIKEGTQEQFLKSLMLD